MPKSHSMVSIQDELERYARDQFAPIQDRGLIAALAKRLDVSYSTIQRAFLGAKVSASMARRVRSKIAETRELRWPKEPAAVLKKYSALQQEIDPSAFDRAAEMLDLVVDALLRLAKAAEPPSIQIEVPFWHYLRGYIATDRAAYALRRPLFDGDEHAREHDRCEHEKRALQHYKTAFALLSSACDADSSYQERYGLYLDKLRFSIFSVHFNIHPPGKRASSEVLMAELRQGDYLSLIKKLIEAEPKSRNIRHAGLKLASVLGESEGDRSSQRGNYVRHCEVLYAGLCMVDERFESLDFQPADFTHSLANDPDLAFFRSNHAKKAPHGPVASDAT